MKNIFNEVIDLFKFGKDQAPEEKTINNIEEGVEFKGAKLWVLILAIFVASLGLNMNSTAVIIGAMLISPLMGPILGLGLSVGIRDTQLLKKAFHNYWVATVFSVATAFIYFKLSPFEEVQSELLARTSPTIYDVLIAFCGGLAGIIGLNSKSQRGGNVIPGVAIATALMPPLCTVGFSLATANWWFAAGAFYLYLINTVFISLATYIGVEFIFKFKKVEEEDVKTFKNFNTILILIGVFVILPSLYLTINMVRESLFKDNVHQFCKEVVKFEGTHLIGTEVNYDSCSIKLVLMGEEVDSANIEYMKDKLPDYYLEDAKLSIIQGAKRITEETVRNMVSSSEDRILASTQIFAHEKEMNDTLQAELNKYHELEHLTTTLFPEVRINYPQVTSLTLTRGKQVRAESDSISLPSIVALYEIKGRMTSTEQVRLKEWLKLKLGEENVIVVESIAK